MGKHLKPVTGRTRKTVLIALPVVASLTTAGLALAAPSSGPAGDGSLLGEVSGLIGGSGSGLIGGSGPVGGSGSGSGPVGGSGSGSGPVGGSGSGPVGGALGNPSSLGATITPRSLLPSVLGSGTAAPTPVGTQASAPGVAADGAHVVAEQWINPQMLDLTVDSPALGGPTPVRLLLPRDWYTNPTASWPTLYLLPGFNERVDYRSWTVFTDVASFMADKNVLTVMPSDGWGGFFTNHWNYGAYGPPAWETLHTRELPQILESGYRASTRRAVAGLSGGGYGAMAYAAKNPGMYGAAASYSGLLHPSGPGFDRLTQVLMQKLGDDPNAIWGDPLLQGDIWRSNDPWWLAEGLRGTKLYLSVSTGVPGSHDPSLAEDIQRLEQAPDAASEPLVFGTALETATAAMTYDFQTRLTTLGIPVAKSYYPVGGTHSWPYWQDAFKDSWPVLAAGLGVPAS